MLNINNGNKTLKISAKKNEGKQIS